MGRLARMLPVAAVLGLAGCALVSPPPDGHGQALAGAPLDIAAKFAAPKDGRKRDRAAMSAQYNLALEADEQGPPRAGQIFAANVQREAIVRETLAGGRGKSAGLQPSQWQAIGPASVGGRVRAIAFDPRNPVRAFAGTATGGLWVTEDGGTSWRTIFDFLPNLSVTTIAVDPAFPDVMYAGTGEASAGYIGVGAFKSTDGGRAWRFLEATDADATADWRFVNRLAIHPGETQVLLAALTSNNGVSGAIYRSVDGGANWAKVAPMRALDIAFDPNNPANAVAGLGDGTIAYSRDAGLTWTRSAPLVAAPSGRGNTARAEIAFSRSLPGLVYASVDNAKGEVWRSSDSGAAWEKLATPGHLNTQGDYDNAIWADPTDANHLIVGGLDLYRSTDGGLTFEKVSDWRSAPASPHSDHHALVSPPNFGPANPSLWNGNDGGVYRADNVGRLNAQSATAGGWVNLNNGLAVTQFYGGAGRTAAGGRIVGGSQDNGSLQYSQGVWQIYRGGDGGQMAVDPSNDSWVFGEYVYAAVHRSAFGGPGSAFICSGITEALPSEGSNPYCGANATKKANFIAPLVLDPNNANRLLVGANSLWVTDSAKGAAAWRTMKAPSSATDNFINAVAVAEGNGNVTWVGHNNGELYRSLDALSAAPLWARVGAGVLPARLVLRITIDRANANRVLVAFTGFVANNLWETTDAGATWRSVTGNLPNAPIFDVKRHPANPEWLYAATSVGVFASENGGLTWSTSNEGPANIRVRELFWLDDATLVAATFGRGMYKASVPAGGPASYQDLWWAGPQENGWGLSITQHGATLFVAFYIYDAQGRAQWVVMPGGTWNATFTAFTGALYIPSGSYFGNYNSAAFVANASVGSATLAFSGPATATLAYTINGVSGTKSIQRQSFGVGDPTPVGSFADLWWGGPAENGWGVAISQQYRTLFVVWYTYDAAGRTTWYVMPGGTWTAFNTYTGTAYRTTGSPWLGAAYSSGALNAVQAGTLTLRFDDANRGTMNYSVDGTTASKPIFRQPF
jgi:hypothetical protein